jgi:hypothetical protein
MTRVSITRLRLRSTFYELPFIWHAVRSRMQAERAEGCLGIAVRRHRGAYWTMTLWRDAVSMRAFMLSGAHRNAMPKLAGWCDEAAVGHWEQEAQTMPAWAEAEDQLARNGRTSLIANPSPAHAAGNTMGSA